MPLHHCSIPRIPTLPQSNGHAIEVCSEEMSGSDGTLIVTNDEYSSSVPFCPFCGADFSAAFNKRWGTQVQPRLLDSQEAMQLASYIGQVVEADLGGIFGKGPRDQIRDAAARSLAALARVSK